MLSACVSEVSGMQEDTSKSMTPNVSKVALAKSMLHDSGRIVPDARKPKHKVRKQEKPVKSQHRSSQPPSTRQIDRSLPETVAIRP